MNEDSVNQLQAIAQGTTPTSDFLATADIDLLPSLAELFTSDLPIKGLEALEQVYKAILKKHLHAGTSEANARAMMEFQKSVGLLLKYKSYTVKAAHPLGYSVFLQEPQQGFSFQRHITHKAEVFHILKTMAGGFVFICDHEDWERVYEKTSFEAWLNGTPNPEYDQFKFIPQPGDVFSMDVGTVHTAIGCILEEYATVSTDMVDRLHDQNADRPTPPHFNRAYSHEKLQHLPVPTSWRRIKWEGKSFVPESIAPEHFSGGIKVLLADGPLEAWYYKMDAGASHELRASPDQAIALHVTAGSGTLYISPPFGPPAPGILLAPGHTVTLPPAMHYSISSGEKETLVWSEHHIRPDVALQY